eukprot:m.29132 g.29132  ORF g.29132 m.29132 type:complete len:69 (-) comp9125_c0_seq1:106-312(-)
MNRFNFDAHAMLLLLVGEIREPATQCGHQTTTPNAILVQCLTKVKGQSRKVPLFVPRGKRHVQSKKKK